jgi:succinylglutamate desuccinylase
MTNKIFWNEIKEFIREQDRILFSCCGQEDGPFVILSAGIHGNEPSGVLALRNVFNKIAQLNIQINGSLLAFIGNRTALNNYKRYSVVDLNRLWYDENLEKLHHQGFGGHELNPDILEMMKIDELISDFENTASGKEHYFIDLHTTSAPSIPFAFADKNDKMLESVMNFPLPVIINVNEYLFGTMLNYFENRNFHGIIFESGQHDEFMSVKKHEALIWMALVNTKALKKSDVPNFNAHFQLINGLSDDPHKKFEITHHLKLKSDDKFEMIAGFVNFQKIEKGELLAKLNGKYIRAPQDGRIFMPLYQSRGEDAFFIVKRIN